MDSPLMRIGGLAMILASALAAGAGCEDPSLKFNQEGLTLYRAGDYTRARAAFEEAISQNPDVGEYYFNRGICEQAIGHWDQALFNYEMSMRLSPKVVDAYNNAAQCHVEKGDLAKAQQVLVTGTLANPYTGEAFVNIGRFFASRNDIPSARLWMAKAVAADPENAKAHQEYAQFLLKIGERDKAIQEFRKSFEINPLQPETSATLTELSPTGSQLPPPKPQTK
jgi:tetratricopeptide (TPR) repeat protein